MLTWSLTLLSDKGNPKSHLFRFHLHYLYLESFLKEIFERHFKFISGMGRKDVIVCVLILAG